jgi:hypothetical protein
MAGPSRTLKLTYLGDASQLKKTNDDINRDFTTLGDRFKKFGANAAKAFAVAGAAAGAMAVKFGKDAVDAASDLNESINALEVVFGPVSDEMLKLSDAAATTVGLSKTEFNGLAVSFSAFTKSLATDNKDAVAVTDELTQRIADFASVMNLEVSDAGAKFQSILAGSSEVSRQFGIDTSAAAVTQYALEAGLIASKSEMDENIRVQATYGLLMQETDQLTGDFANTSDELANSQRILKAEFENVKAEAGQQLLPILKDIIAFVTERGLPAFQDFIDRLAKFIGRVKEFWQDNAPAFREAFDRIRTVVVAVWESLKPLITAIGDLFTAIFGGVKEGGSGNAFLTFLDFAVGLIETIGAVLKPVIDLLAGFFDLLAKIANSGFVQTVVGAIGNVASGIRNTFTGVSQAASTNAVTAPRSFSAGLPSVAGPTRTNVTNITVNGATDPESTARQIRRLEQDSLRRSGPTQTLVFAP